jgi:hypothetical protein
MNKALEKLKEEFLAVLPPTIFFFIALHIIGLVRILMTKGTGLPITSSAQIAIAALIIGKAVLLADLWPPINRFPQKPLIYNIVWKTIIYYVVASFIHYLERLYDCQGGRRNRRRQRKAALRDRVAAFLGAPDHPACRHSQLLRDPGTGTGAG